MKIALVTDGPDKTLRHEVVNILDPNMDEVDLSNIFLLALTAIEWMDEKTLYQATGESPDYIYALVQYINNVQTVIQGE